MAEFDTGFELLPADDAGALTAEQALDAALDAPALDEDTEPEPTPLGRGWDFNFETGQFRRHGFAPAVVTDVEHLRVWIEKTLRTARFAHPIYSDQYGTDFPEGLLLGRQFSPELVGQYVDGIKGALLAHDRIEQIKDVNFTGDPAFDLLEVEYTVVLDDEEEVTMQTVVGGGL